MDRKHKLVGMRVRCTLVGLSVRGMVGTIVGVAIQYQYGKRYQGVLVKYDDPRHNESDHGGVYENTSWLEPWTGERGGMT